VGLNTAYVLVEACFGILTGSLALLADAAHNLTDVAGLLIAWGAAVLAKRAGNATFTFGFGRATILAAMLNATAILIGVVVVIWEAAQRFATMVEVPGLTILLVALVGIGVNTGSALLFIKSQKEDLAKAEKINTSYVSRILRLTLLAPDIVEMVLDGRQPQSLTLKRLQNPFPISWKEQSKELL
jgi:cation diffusion facilitator family transporter